MCFEADKCEITIVRLRDNCNFKSRATKIVILVFPPCPIMQPFSSVAATTSRLDSDEEIIIWQPGGERNSNWCKVPTVRFLSWPLGTDEAG